MARHLQWGTVMVGRCAPLVGIDIGTRSGKGVYWPRGCASPPGKSNTIRMVVFWSFQPVIGDGSGDTRVDPGVKHRRPVRGVLHRPLFELRHDRLPRPCRRRVCIRHHAGDVDFATIPRPIHRRKLLLEIQIRSSTQPEARILRHWMCAPHALDFVAVDRHSQRSLSTRSG
jgi:hypothetical protein